MKHLERALDKQNQWWKYPAVLFAGSVFGSIIGAIPLMIVITVKKYQSNGNLDDVSPTDFAAYGIDTNLGLILSLLPFIVGLIIVTSLLKPVHKRTLKEVINGTNRIRWKRFFFAALIWMLIMGAYLITDYCFNPDNFTLNFNIKSFIPLILISVLLLPLQTTYEEVLFRGYLAQGVAAWTKSRWFAILIPAVLFGLMHSFNPEVEAYGFWKVMPQYIFFGLILGLIAVLDDGIETAMGMHAANNVFASIFVTSKASVLQTAALLEAKEINPSKEIIVLIICSIIFVAILSVKYKWNYAVLNKKITYSLKTDENLEN